MVEELATEVDLIQTMEKKMDAAHLCYNNHQQSTYCLYPTIKIVKGSVW